jgi:CheY-like chemotaxis protein
MSRVLIVEDTALARQSLARILNHEGHEAMAACNGMEALETLEKCAQCPDVVLLDVMMPRMDGVKFLETLRADPRYASMRVIVMTGSLDSSRLNRLRALRVEALLKKAEFDLEDLLKRVRSNAA